LILYNDGGVEKYEGDDAFKWVEEIISKLNPSLPHLQQPVPPHLQQPVPPHLQQPIPQQSVNPNLQQPVPPHINHIENKKKPNKKESTKSKITDLVELESLEDEEESTILEDIETEDRDSEYNNIEMNDLFPPKQASLRSGPGSYDLNNSFGDKKNDTKIKKGIKSSTESVVKKGKMSVMEAAMAMQKTREKEVESEPKPVFA